MFQSLGEFHTFILLLWGFCLFVVVVVVVLLIQINELIMGSEWPGGLDCFSVTLPAGLAYIIGTSDQRPENGHWLGSWNAQGQSRARNLQAGHFAISHLKVSEERVASVGGIFTPSWLRAGDDLMCSPPEIVRRVFFFFHRHMVPFALRKGLHIGKGKEVVLCDKRWMCGAEIVLIWCSCCLCLSLCQMECSMDNGLLINTSMKTG